MARNLALVAGFGIGISAVCLGVAAALGADDLGVPSFGWLGRCDDSNGVPVTGNRREIAWNDRGDDVRISVPANISYRPGEGTMLIATGDTDALSHLVVTDGDIKFDCRGLDVDTDDLTLVLPGRPFSEFAVNGSSNLTLENLDQPELELSIYGSGKVQARGRADQVEVEIAGTGEVQLIDFTARDVDANIFGTGEVRATGTTESLEVNIAGSGDAELGGFSTGRLEVNIAGSGDATVAPRDSADVNIAGSGDVTFVTQPAHVESSVAGSGRIVHAPSVPVPAAPPQPAPAPAPAPTP
jgi:hypothetical protein